MNQIKVLGDVTYNFKLANKKERRNWRRCKIWYTFSKSWLMRRHYKMNEQVNPQLVIDNLATSNAELQKENAILRALITQLQNKDNETSDDE